MGVASCSHSHDHHCEDHEHEEESELPVYESTFEAIREHLEDLVWYLEQQFSYVTRVDAEESLLSLSIDIEDQSAQVIVLAQPADPEDDTTAIQVSGNEHLVQRLRKSLSRFLSALTVVPCAPSSLELAV